jgi:hypothetical protein
VGEKRAEAHRVWVGRHGLDAHPILSKTYTRFVHFYEKCGLKYPACHQGFMRIAWEGFFGRLRRESIPVDVPPVPHPVEEYLIFLNV